MKKTLLSTVREKFPKAINATLVDKCDSCKESGAIFFQFEGDEYLGLGWFSGGVYCPKCGFSNSARVHVDSLRALTKEDNNYKEDLSFTMHDDATSNGCVMCGNEWMSLNEEGYCSSCWTVWNS